MKVNKKLNFSTFLKFLIVGGGATLLQYIVMAMMIFFLGFSAVSSSSVGYLVSGIFNYFLNYRYTFEGDYSHRSALIKFILVSGLGFLINRILLDSFLAFGFSLVLSQLMATTFVVLSNFCANLFWTFESVKEK